MNYNKLLYFHGCPVHDKILFLILMALYFAKATSFSLNLYPFLVISDGVQGPMNTNFVSTILVSLIFQEFPATAHVMKELHVKPIGNSINIIQENLH